MKTTFVSLLESNLNLTGTKISSFKSLFCYCYI